MTGCDNMTGLAVYLDHNATTPVRPETVEAVREALAVTGNPSSVHRQGRLARRIVETARESIAALVNAKLGQVIFTSGGTEANILALRGCGRRRVLASAVEHVSVLDAVSGVERIAVTADGIVDLVRLEAMLAADDTPAVVSLMLANNETGVVQPVAEAAELARRYGALIHCDAVQAAGKMPIDLQDLGVHLLSLSAHKLGGPSGAGALIVDDCVPLVAMASGGGQERGLRAGTENVAGITGFGAAARSAANCDLAGAWRRMRDDMERRLLDLAPATTIFGSRVPRLPNTSCVAMTGLAGETQVMALDLAGIAVSAGSACSSGKVAESHVLKAMGCDAERASAAIRVSFGWTTTAEDVNRFVEVWSGLSGRVASGIRPERPAA